MRIAGILAVLVLLLSGCRTQRQVQKEFVYVERTDTVSLVRWRVDSVVVRDSVSTLIKGDTVMIERWHTAERERLRIDTVEKLQTRNVYLTRTETKTVTEYRQRWWQTALMWIGIAGLALGIGWLFRALRSR